VGRVLPGANCGNKAIAEVGEFEKVASDAMVEK
jgi:hypothetical protein